MHKTRFQDKVEDMIIVRYFEQFHIVTACGGPTNQDRLALQCSDYEGVNRRANLELEFISSPYDLLRNDVCEVCVTSLLTGTSMGKKL